MEATRIFLNMNKKRFGLLAVLSFVLIRTGTILGIFNYFPLVYYSMFISGFALLIYLVLKIKIPSDTGKEKVALFQQRTFRIRFLSVYLILFFSTFQLGVSGLFAHNFISDRLFVLPASIIFVLIGLPMFKREFFKHGFKRGWENIIEV